MRHETGSWYCWLLVATVALALFFGWGPGWTLALAVIGIAPTALDSDSHFTLKLGRSPNIGLLLVRDQAR